MKTFRIYVPECNSSTVASNAVTGTGGTGQVATFSDTNAIVGSSNLIFDGGTLSLTGDQIIKGELKIQEFMGTDSVGFNAPSDIKTGGYSLTLPDDQGSSGQALVLTDSSGTLDWITVGTSSQRTFSIQPNQISINTLLPQSVAYFVWDQVSYSPLINGTVIYYLSGLNNRGCTLDVWNETTNASIASLTVPSGTPNGIQKFSFTNPIADTLISIRVNKLANGGINPQIYGVYFKF